jgi:hypothetical protein
MGDYAAYRRAQRAGACSPVCTARCNRHERTSLLFSVKLYRQIEKRETNRGMSLYVILKSTLLYTQCIQGNRMYIAREHAVLIHALCNHVMKRHLFHRSGCFHGCLVQTNVPERGCSAQEIGAAHACDSRGNSHTDAAKCLNSLYAIALPDKEQQTVNEISQRSATK